MYETLFCKYSTERFNIKTMEIGSGVEARKRSKGMVRF